MLRRVVSGITLILLLAGMLTLAFRFQPAKAMGVIHIRADGSVDPPTAPIQRNGDRYTLTGNVTSDTDGIVIERNSMTLDGAGHTVRGIGAMFTYGIYLYGRSNVTIKNMKIDAFNRSIYLVVSSNNTLCGNNITNSVEGIYLHASSNNIILTNIASNIGAYGICVSMSSLHNIIDRNNITSCGHGIHVSSFSNCNNISGNDITNNELIGIGIWASENIVSENNIRNNREGVFVRECSNNTIFGNNITNNEVTGINLWDTSNNSISENDLIHNGDGVWLYNSSSNTISRNHIANNSGGWWPSGIYFQYSSNNTISGNNIIDNNPSGIYFESSSNNSISGNNIASNDESGIYLYESSNNKFYHNQFTNNPKHANIQTSDYANSWDDGYPSGGNYWSNYTGTDLFRGLYQNETGSDGIGDTTYAMDENNTDTYPLMGPLGPSTMAGENITVFPLNDICMIFENVTAEGLTTVNETETGPEPPLGFMVDKFYIIETSASYSGKITIRIVYDDSNMTPEQEEAVQLMQWNEMTQEWMNITIYVDRENNVIIGETNHLSMFGVTKLELVNYIAITEVTLSKTIVGEGYSVTINTTIANLGDMPQTFNITVCANINAIYSKNVTLASSNYTTITFTWNTTSFAKDNYTISAYAWPVPSETDTTDNTLFADECLCVTIAGDMDCDLDVDLYDAVKLLVIYGVKKDNPKYDPNCDIDGDGDIDLYDAVRLLTHYGQKDP